MKMEKIWELTERNVLYVIGTTDPQIIIIGWFARRVIRSS